MDEGGSIRRRRECLACGQRFTTFEVCEALRIIVIKKDGTKETFERAKLLGGIMKATEKRPVDAEKLASEIESELYSSLDREISTAKIGEMVMERLKAADPVAYVRFASVYREFQDVDSFLEELRSLKRKARTRKNDSGHL